MSETMLEVYPNEMLARWAADVLEQEGIPAFVKPRFAGYGVWGHMSFIPHALYVAEEDIARARAIIQDIEGEKEGGGQA